VFAEYAPDPARVRRVAGVGDVSGDEPVRAGEDESAAATGRQVLQDREELDGAFAGAGSQWDEVVVPRAAGREGPRFLFGGEGDQWAAPSAWWLPAAGSQKVVESGPDGCAAEGLELRFGRDGA